MVERGLSVLDKANVGRLLTEALTADIEAVLADETSTVSADAARARALSVLAGARVPDGFVRHFVDVVIFVKGSRCAVVKSSGCSLQA